MDVRSRSIGALQTGHLSLANCCLLMLQLGSCKLQSGESIAQGPFFRSAVGMPHSAKGSIVCPSDCVTVSSGQWPGDLLLAGNVGVGPIQAAGRRISFTARAKQSIDDLKHLWPIVLIANQTIM